MYARKNNCYVSFKEFSPKHLMMLQKESFLINKYNYNTYNHNKNNYAMHEINIW